MKKHRCNDKEGCALGICVVEYGSHFSHNNIDFKYKNDDSFSSVDFPYCPLCGHRNKEIESES